MGTQSSLFDGIKENLALAFSFMPRKPQAPRVSQGQMFDAPDPSEIRQVESIEEPLPPCKPLNQAEQTEADMLARLRGALYSDDR